MKRFIYLFFLFWIAIIKCEAQSAGTNYAIAYTVKKCALPNMVVKNGRRIVEHRVVVPASEMDPLMAILKMGIAKNSTGRMSQRDTLLKIYPVTPVQNTFFENTVIFDSISNCLTVSTGNTMYATTTSFVFDSIGKLTRIMSSFASEVHAPTEKTVTTYQYVPEQNTIVTSTAFHDYICASLECQLITQTVWDPSHQFPISETIMDLRSQKKTCRTFYYKKNKLKKIRIVELAQNKTIKTTMHKYYFSLRSN